MLIYIDRKLVFLDMYVRTFLIFYRYNTAYSNIQKQYFLDTSTTQGCFVNNNSPAVLYSYFVNFTLFIKGISKSCKN